VSGENWICIDLLWEKGKFGGEGRDYNERNGQGGRGLKKVKKRNIYKKLFWRKLRDMGGEEGQAGGRFTPGEGATIMRGGALYFESNHHQGVKFRIAFTMDSSQKRVDQVVEGWDYQEAIHGRRGKKGGKR